MKPEMHVVCAVIINETGNIFAACRPEGKALGGFWEFPGGKIEAGETEKEALGRELKEELEAAPRILYKLEDVRYSYSDFSIILSPWICLESKQKEYRLHEHSESRWLFPDQLDTVTWCPADVELIQKVKETDFSLITSISSSET